MAFVLGMTVVSGAALGASSNPGTSGLADRLGTIRSRVVALEGGLLESLKSRKQAQANVKKIQQLMVLQKQERELGKKRLGELEAKVLELETRRGTLIERIHVQQEAIRHALISVERSVVTDGAVSPSLGAGERVRNIKLPERERTEAPRRKLLANLVDRGLKEIEALKVDLADAEQLETRIQEEKEQLAYLFQDLKEQESILELNRQLQGDLIRKRHEERLAQLENYQRLKSAEQQVESLIGQFNARLELERTTEAERLATKAIPREIHVPAQPESAIAGGGPNLGLSGGVFARLKGRLPLPVADGRVISSFGRGFDPRSRLYIFKKGVDITTAKGAEVHAISSGKIAYSGELPDYGRVAIVDHGEHFYSLCAHLGGLKLKAGDSVAAGDVLGTADDSGSPVYFEIRARNVAVNPLQWVANSFSLNQ
jgi:septal ring factor EnvC (AmiA/AmiB activator)